VNRGWRGALKRGLAGVALRTGVSRLLRRAGGVRIFGYHHVLPREEAPPWIMAPLVISPSTFATHLDELARGFDVWSVDDAVALLLGERLPPRSGREVAVITFDDGYRSVLRHAGPLLHARGLPAAMYVPTGGGPLVHDRLHALLVRCVAQRMRVTGTAVADRVTWALARADRLLDAGHTVDATDAILDLISSTEGRALCDALAARLGEPEDDTAGLLLDWSELARLRALGFTIGAHTETHALLPALDDDALRDELARPRETIRARLGVTPATVAYPAGRYDARVARAAAAAGYRAALTTEDRPNLAGADLFRLGRKVLSDAHGPEPELIAAHLGGLFTRLGLSRAVPGDRPPPAMPWSRADG
jgi:peptidoglycan/xylan/chitin deacetylase (PgdA/CDA1 family)